MVRFWTPPGSSISLGVITAPFDADAVVAELRRGIDDGDRRSGQDQLTLLDPRLDPDEMTLQGLMRIAAVSRRMGALSPKDGMSPARSVFVADEGRARRGLEVYIAMRENLRGPSPVYSIVTSVALGSTILGAPDLSPHFYRWPELGNLLTLQ